MLSNNKKNIVSKEMSILLKKRESGYDGGLSTAVQSGDISKVTDLLNSGTNINAKDNVGQTPLHTANGEDIAGLLIDKGADINAKDDHGQTPLHTANGKGIARLLIDKGADVNARDYLRQTPLHKSISESVAKLLIDNGADVNARDYLRQTPLHKSISESVAKLLINNGADINAKDDCGRTPLHYVVGESIARLLIERGADINAKGIFYDTPFEIALEDKKTQVANFLANAKDRYGKAMLHYAAEDNNLDLVRVLVENGASIHAGDKDSKTPLDIARDKEYNNIVNYLEEELNKEREKPVQRKRRHHHGGHNSHHLSRKLRSIDSSNQPEIVASSSTRTSSWINDLFGWVKSSIGGLLDSKSSTITRSPISQIDVKMDINGTIMLLDVLVRKVTSQKYVSTVDQSISPLEAQGYALNIKNRFEKVVDQAGLKSGVSMHRLNIDYMKVRVAKTIRETSIKFDGLNTKMDEVDIKC